MEIEHLAGIPYEQERGARRQWTQMEQHFATVRRKCPMLRGATAQEAICAWFDYYSPELIVRLGQPKTSTLGSTVIRRYPVTFLGSDIFCKDKRTHWLKFPLPLGERPEPLWVRVLENDTLIFEASYSKASRGLISLQISEQNRNSFFLELLGQTLSQDTAGASAATCEPLKLGSVRHANVIVVP
jgi:hypothetical protein